MTISFAALRSIVSTAPAPVKVAGAIRDSSGSMKKCLNRVDVARRSKAEDVVVFIKESVWLVG